MCLTNTNIFKPKNKVNRKRQREQLCLSSLPALQGRAPLLGTGIWENSLLCQAGLGCAAVPRGWGDTGHLQLPELLLEPGANPQGRETSWGHLPAGTGEKGHHRQTLNPILLP